MEERFFYEEEIFFTSDDSRELGENQGKIIETLRGNLAVGVVGGFFEEGYPMPCTIWDCPLRSLWSAPAANT